MSLFCVNNCHYWGIYGILRGRPPYLCSSPWPIKLICNFVKTFHTTFQVCIFASACLCQKAGVSQAGGWGGGFSSPPLVFGQTVNPISTRGQIMPTTLLRAQPPVFSKLPAVIQCGFHRLISAPSNAYAVCFRFKIQDTKSYRASIQPGHLNAYLNMKRKYEKKARRPFISWSKSQILTQMNV